MLISVTFCCFDTLIETSIADMSPGVVSEVSAIPDKELIAGILAGRKNLFAVIVRRYNQQLYGIGMSLLNDDTEVEDAMQATYLNAYTALKNFSHKSAFSTWLTRIMINECYLRLKKWNRARMMNRGYVENRMQQALADYTYTTFNNTSNAELRTVLENAIRNLPGIYRSVFVLREIEDLNVSETQNFLSISEANVKIRLNRAKAMLRKFLSSYYKKEDFHFHLSRCSRMVDRVTDRVECVG